MLVDICEFECVDEWLQAIGHLRRRIGVDDEYGAHLVVFEVIVLDFTHKRPMVL